MTLTDFLLARIAEDEVSARKLIPIGSSTQWPGWHRLLVECEAKRRIVMRLAEEVLPPAGHTVSAYDPEAYLHSLASEVLEYLALPYADHPDYREEWKP